MIHPDKLFGRLGNRMFQMAYIYSQMRKGATGDIYVQDPEYFDQFRNEVRVLYGDGIGHIDKIALHVRRGANPVNPDEPKHCYNSFYVDLTSTDYYDRAISLFPDEHFLVFSDDIEWCKEHFKGDRFSFSESHDEIKDLNLMASCKGVIIANSSYSWWGAYLSNGKVVAPLAWYTDGVERTKCPKEWTRI